MRLLCRMAQSRTQQPLVLIGEPKLHKGFCENIGAHGSQERLGQCLLFEHRAILLEAELIQQLQSTLAARR